MERFPLFLLCFSLMHDAAISSTIESISTTQSLTDGDTMVSAGGTFAVGFLSIPEGSKNRYLGIWYNKVPSNTVAWIANRNAPLNDSSGVLKITANGTLALHTHNDTIIWHSNSSEFAQRPVAVLLDSGNLVVKEDGSNDDDLKSFIWQSFDYPYDTLLPGMKLGSDLTTGLTRYLTSPISSDDPSEGFEPKVPEEWNQTDWSDGCVRINKLNCQDDGFVQLSGVKLPNTQRASGLNNSMSLEECANLCMKNCSCTAYASLDIRNGGSGCLFWYDELIDIRVLSDPQQDLFVRMSRKDIDEILKSKHKSKNKKVLIIAFSSVISVGILILCLSFIVYRRKKNKINYRSMRHNTERYAHAIEDQEEDLDLPLFDMATLISATNNFSTNKILGKGGYGTVYQGTLKDGREIAVKRLSENSRQGLQEFKSEVMNVVKLQHRNLVKLLGCCIQAEERMLIYEFMPNKSLDYFIFDKERSTQLLWPQRFLIIVGIARGVLYLHQDSRHRIVHRDLKASNVLLDDEMNAKISDFGLARSFKGNENEANTTRVVGTYGYLSPEYLIDGIFSTKSDVYSFGVLVLEIVSGKRNRGFSDKNHRFNLLGHVWTLFMDGNCSEIIDPSIRNSSELSGVIRVIHVGLLCVQQNPEDRPSMAHALMMLSSECTLPQPKMPGFFTERDPVGDTSSSSNTKLVSFNEVTVTVVHPR
ncbi:G-type lectin S-receptor-like serine/threonine-protein kinase At4g27290 isoform X2 [Arachis ipaensis]|uniref:G-type lectin S-receptor-like serine/threonine-protein kinase At4g27290 isoform X2 n=1 Tax=Arachis ipaensis TaxID=130454 RepID=UPI000A2B8E81|nr:G-type lectin S-receptor-like serine/threonine-protein kinase At4g27290 isoform X2 [Arachis ipaensis]XP_025673561.1 G-type lectin S-receptor-like serine/threonine-protein kinase At4g27290 isoform X2 [Arachis hypogaea]